MFNNNILYDANMSKMSISNILCFNCITVWSILSLIRSLGNWFVTIVPLLEIGRLWPISLLIVINNGAVDFRNSRNVKVLLPQRKLTKIWDNWIILWQRNCQRVLNNAKLIDLRTWISRNPLIKAWILWDHKNVEILEENILILLGSFKELNLWSYKRRTSAFETNRKGKLKFLIYIFKCQIFLLEFR